MVEAEREGGGRKRWGAALPPALHAPLGLSLQSSWLIFLEPLYPGRQMSLWTGWGEFLPRENKAEDHAGAGTWCVEDGCGFKGEEVGIAQHRLQRKTQDRAGLHWAPLGATLPPEGSHRS